MSSPHKVWLWAIITVVLLSKVMATLHCIRKVRNGTAIRQDLLPDIILTILSVTYIRIVTEEFGLIQAGPREIWHIRYIGWTLTAPLLLFSLLLFTRMPTPELLLAVMSTLVLPVGGWIAASVGGPAKQYFYPLGLLALIVIGHQLFYPVGVFGFRVESFRENYVNGAIYLLAVWSSYAICWYLSEGNHTLSPTWEMVSFGILDLFGGPVFLFAFIIYPRAFGGKGVSAQGGSDMYFLTKPAVESQEM